MASNAFNDYIKPSLIFGFIILVFSQLSLGWSFLIVDIVKFYIIGLLIPSIHSGVIIGLFQLIPQSKIDELKFHLK